MADRSSSLRPEKVRRQICPADSTKGVAPCSPRSGLIGPGRMGSSAWRRLLPEFLAYHQTPLNVTLHLFTTPLGVLATLSLVQAMLPTAMLVGAVLYAALLGVFLPAGLWLTTTAVLLALCGLAALLHFSVLTSLGLIVVAVVLQEAAHLLASEPTLESTYRDAPSRLWRWLEHTFLLLPLVLTAPRYLRGSVLSWLVPRSRVFTTHLDAETYGAELERIGQFVRDQRPPESTTAHWWQQELVGDVRMSFDVLAEAVPLSGMFRRLHGCDDRVDVLSGMNEIYVAAPASTLSSDQVFYTSHIDGPWALYPLAAVYRCMLAINENSLVHTHFPLNGRSASEPETYTLSTGDALAFDYNREPHYITRDAGSAADRRISLKLHYLVYPKWLGPYGRGLGRLSTWYNTRARRLFLDTITPEGLPARIQAAGILLATRGFEFIVRFVGWENLLYVLLLGLVSLLMQDGRLFLAGTSFVHYLLYLGVGADRELVSFGRFKRNAMFFKALALGQLAGWYLYFCQFSPLSLLLIVAGFGLSAWATAVLGINRTYYGAELGYCSPETQRALPYGWIPHPMILGSIVGLLGIQALTPLRQQIPWLVPLHIAAYLCVLAQERRLHTADDATRPEPAGGKLLPTSPELSH